ncbi:hypothetical protein LCGC14_2369290 [marine sediment metagenome]|uniref:Uncharacterized protein n=1 Tax=marine sediment metagenome TaxID=412755 RepID=A0A0F9C432_9ZZZZ
MPRITHTAQAPLGAYGDYSVANAADYVYQAATGSSGDDGEKTLLTGKELILIKNGATPRTITITSVNDEFGRTGNIAAYAIGANEFAMFGPFKQPGWRQTDGFLYFEANNAEVLIAVIRLP